jgi:hypothetical protein
VFGEILADEPGFSGGLVRVEMCSEDSLCGSSAQEARLHWKE